mgnify:CR=1 FL=1
MDKVDIRNLDPKTKNYIKNLEHTIDIQNELIEAQEKIIHYQKMQIEQQQKYVQKVQASLDHLKTIEKER